MSTVKFNKICPYIEIKPFPINNSNDNLEDDENTKPLFHVIVSQGQLKMLFLVVLNEDDNLSLRKYETIRCEYLSLHGINERDEYLGVVDNINVSADTTIVNEIFQWTLQPYGIRLIECNFHDFEFFESDKEGKGFVFENEETYNILKDLINKKCIKMMSNTYVTQY